VTKVFFKTIWKPFISNSDFSNIMNEVERDFQPIFTRMLLLNH